MERRRIRVTGTVQGVGFRPFVHGLATELRLAGRVANDAHGVLVEVQGPVDRLDRFEQRLRDEPPPLAMVDTITAESIATTQDAGFTIDVSRAGGDRNVLVSADVATCVDCRTEVADPADRRHNYAFTNCTHCGPRFTIVRDVPYDRALTTMAAFPLCEVCAAEYADPTDRRFHAQPVCCPDCGPHLALETSGGDDVTVGDDAAIAAAVSLLGDGQVVAVKGLGGYHLAARADDQQAVSTLRSGKHREEKPFAVMVADLEAARRLCRVTDDEAALLTDRARPIVLLERLPDARVADAVAPRTRTLGVMLPYTPLHELLLAAVGTPLVLTSGNRSDEPIAHEDDDARRRLGPMTGAILTHDRPIHVRVDDSVARMVAGTPVLLRRSRGFAPRPVRLPVQLDRHVLAVGAEQKNTVCLARDHHAFLSHHIGDLTNHETLVAFHQAIAHLGRLFDVHPTVVAHDLHPEYLSTKEAMELAAEDPDLELVGVQHHHAHVAACLADNGRADRVIGVAFDGTGYGTDGTIWGGEVLVGDLVEVERVAHLSTVPLPGGAAAIREPWRMALAHLDGAFEGDLPDDLDLVRRNTDRADDVLAVGRSGINSPPTSSMGRLFDAVAALVGLHDVVSHEGQAAIALEQASEPAIDEAYPVVLVEAATSTIDAGAVVREVVADLRRGTDTATIGARFHGWVVAAIATTCRTVRDQQGLGTVALSGGVFQNALLVERVVPRLRADGFEVLMHRQVPPNDGGVALGQAAVAAARLGVADARG